MQRRHALWLPVAGAALVALFLLVPPVHAGIDVGDLAPDFAGKEFFNTDEVCLKDLRGRMVFLKLFSTG